MALQARTVLLRLCQSADLAVGQVPLERALVTLSQAEAIAQDMQDWWMRSQVLQAIERQQSGLAISD